MNLATADLLHAEIARLQAEIARLRLTDAEREAVEWYANNGTDCPLAFCETLHGLLERTK